MTARQTSNACCARPALALRPRPLVPQTMLEVPHGKQIHNFRAYSASAGIDDSVDRSTARVSTAVPARGASERRADSGSADGSKRTAAADADSCAGQYAGRSHAGTT